MKYAELRDFLAQLEQRGELKRIRAEVDPRLEMTEVCDRVLDRAAPRCVSKSRRAALSAAGALCFNRRLASASR